MGIRSEHELGRSRSAAFHHATTDRIEKPLRRSDGVLFARNVANEILLVEGARIEHVLKSDGRLDEPQVAHRGDRAELACETWRRCGEVDEHRAGMRRLDEPAFVEVRVFERRLRGAERDDGACLFDIGAALEAGVRQAHGDIVVEVLVTEKNITHGTP